MIGGGSKKLTIEILTDSRKAVRGFHTVARSADSFGTKMRRVGKIAALAVAGIAVAVGYTLVRAFTSAVKSAARFEESMDKIQGLVGHSAEQVDAYSEAILNMAGPLGTSAQELADALFFITSAGLKGKKALDVLEYSAKAARAGLGETKDVADAVTSAMNAYGKQNLSAADATDVLVATVREGKMEAKDLSKNIGKVIPMAKNLGVSFDEVGGSIAAMTRVGIDTAEAATALESFFTGLYKPTAEGKKALDEVGLSYADLRKTVKERGTLDAMREMQDAFKGNVEQMVKVIGNKRALKAMFSMLGMDAKEVDDIMQKLKNSVGDTDKAFGKVSEGTMFKFQQASEGLRAILIKIGAAALPAIKVILNEITTNWLPRLSGWVSANKEAIKQAFLDIADAIVQFAQDAYEWWSENKQQIKDNITTVGDLIKKMAELLAWLEKNGGLISKYYEIAFRPITAAASGLRTVLGLVDSVKSALGGGGGTVTDLSGAYDPLSYLPPKDAEGGIVTSPRLSITGEAGPEAIVPLTNPSRAAEVLDAAGLTGTTIVNIFLDGKLIEKQVTKRQSERLRRLERAYA